MSEFELKKIGVAAQSAALDKAERYRMLNEPVEAESICLDVLEIDPDNQDVLRVLLLALTDQFQNRLSAAYKEARELLPRLDSEYDQAYYEGVICERRARAHLRSDSPGSGPVAYDWYRKAMEHYERAEASGSDNNDTAILRWNTVARILNRRPDLQPAPDDKREPMLDV